MNRTAHLHVKVIDDPDGEGGIAIGFQVEEGDDHTANGIARLARDLVSDFISTAAAGDKPIRPLPRRHHRGHRGRAPR